MQNSQAKTKKIFTKFFWRAGKVMFFGKSTKKQGVAFSLLKGPFRTKNTTTTTKIANYYAVVFLLRPPNLVCRGPFFERKNVCNSQENGVHTRRAAIVNHPAVLKNTTRSKFTTRSIFSTAGSFGYRTQKIPGTEGKKRSEKTRNSLQGKKKELARNKERKNMEGHQTKASIKLEGKTKGQQLKDKIVS